MTSKAWQARARRLQQLVDSMSKGDTTLEDIEARLDTTIKSPPDPRGRTFIDTVGVRYAIGRDLWRDIHLGVEPRKADFTRRDSAVYVHTVTNSVPWQLVGPAAAVLFVVGVLVGKK